MPDKEKNKTVGNMLYLVATPIGNLSDISERALKVLGEVDFIAAEDTRNTLRLLTHFGIQKPLISYFEHNKKERGEQIAARLEAGESCALVTDAGMPAISDPGSDLVALCAARGIAVTAVPGACASVTALTLSALPSERFCFEGFLPVSKAERRKRLERLSTEERTMLFHEAPHKLRKTLDDLTAVFGSERRISICRELTKLNEEIMRVTLGEAVGIYKEREPRGEYVLVVEGCPEDVSCHEKAGIEMSPLERIEYYMKEKYMTKTEAIKATAKELGVPKNEIYKLTI